MEPDVKGKEILMLFQIVFSVELEVRHAKPEPKKFSASRLLHHRGYRVLSTLQQP
jgi:hypothetical protein